MAVKSENKQNKFTVFLKEERFLTLALLAKKLGLKASSLRNTVYGVKPIRKVVVALEDDKELFDLLPKASRDLICSNNTTEEKKAS